MIKLIALDLDGTLLNDEQSIDKKTIKSLKMAKNRGIKIVLCSSRPLYRMKKFLKILDLECNDQYTISFNGGLIIDNNDNVIFITSLKPKEVAEIIDVSKSSNLTTFLYEEQNIISNYECSDYTSKNLDSSFEVRNFDTLDLNAHTIYKIIFFGDDKDINIMKKNMPKHISKKYKVTSSHSKNIEIVPKENSKSNGLEFISQKTGIKPEEMAVFGDNENDLDMFKYAGYCVAMGNALDSVKEIADYVTTSNNDDGIALALEKMIEKGLI